MELKQYFNLVRRWLWLLLLSAFLAGMTAFMVSRQQTPIYQATATVLINQARSTAARADYNDLITAERIARTYADMLQDWPALEQVAQTTGLAPGYKQLQENYAVEVTVTPLRDTQLVNVIVTSNNPEVATTLANTLPVVFAEMNQARQQQRYVRTRNDLQAEMAAVEEDLLAAEQARQAMGATTPGQVDGERDRLERAVARYQATYASLANSLEDLRLAEVQASDEIVITTPARVPEKPIRPRVLVNTLLAAIVGVMLALGVVFLLEYLDDTIKYPDLVRDQTGLPTLAAVVTISGASPAEKLVALSSTRSPAAEAYRVLRTNLQFSSLDRPVRTLLVSSPSPDEGKSTTAVNLAAVMAQAGQRVVLVDCDLRRPTIHRFFQTPNNSGLTTALLHADADPAAFLQETSLPGLQVLTTGPIPPNPSELLSSERMHELLQKLQAQADMVVLDSPPVLAVADASILATRADGTLLVVNAGVTRLDMLVKTLERLDGLGVRPLGLVLNRLSERRGGYYYYYYYQYASRYGDDGSPEPKGRRSRRAAHQRKANQTL